MNLKFLYILICILGLHSVTAQQHRVIDRKGTQITVTSSQVSTTSIAPSKPNEGDVWIDTASNTPKIWEEGTVPAWKEIASIRNWIPSSQNGSYLVNHLVSYEGALYKNLTSNNMDTTPDNDTINWKEISVDIVPKWKSQTNGGSYASNDIINHNGILYKNLTGTNSDTTPNLDTTNWEALEGEGYAIPLWKSQTNGGSYASNDMINYNGIIYKSLTGTNSDTTPDNDISNWEVLNASLSHSTGIQSGGVLSVGIPNTTFSISDGFGYIVDNVTDPYNPIEKKVIWSGKTNLPATSINSQLITFISIDENGNVIQQSSRWSREQRRDQLVVGVIVHVNQSNIDVVNNEQQTGQDAISQIYDILEGLGFINISGNVFVPNGANLFIDKTEGIMLGGGINYANNTKNPHQLTLPQLSAANVQYRTQTGVNITGLTNQNIDPNIYDVGGIATTVPNKKFTVQRIYSFTSNNVKILPGQALYNSMVDAIAAIGSEEFVTEPSIKTNGMLRGFLVIQEGTVALNNPLNAKFIEASRIAGTAGASSVSSGLLEVVPNWKSNTNGGLYQINDVINFGGFLYKNLTGANTDTSPDLDTTNWEGIIGLPEYESGEVVITTEYTSITAGADVWQSIETFQIPSAGRWRITGIVASDASADVVVTAGFRTGGVVVQNSEFQVGYAAASNRQSGVGIIEVETTGATNYELVAKRDTNVLAKIYSGVTHGFTKVRWEKVAGFLPLVMENAGVPTWKSNTNGGSYAINDIINYNGSLYRNTTGTNTDTTPDLDTTNWEARSTKSNIPLVNDNTTLAGAYSLRLVNSAYTGSAIRVRRSSDDTEQDIGFVDGHLDETSLLNFVGNSSGFVRTWYDQSGAGNDLNQATATSQPLIVWTDTSITTKSNTGKTVIRLVDTNSLRSATNPFPNTDYSIFAMVQMPNTSWWFVRNVQGIQSTNRLLHVGFRNVLPDYSITLAQWANDLQRIVFGYPQYNVFSAVNGTAGKFIKFGSNVAFNTNTADLATASGETFDILGAEGEGEGFISELIIYTNDQRLIVDSIEKNIGGYWLD